MTNGNEEKLMNIIISDEEGQLLCEDQTILLLKILILLLLLMIWKWQWQY